MRHRSVELEVSGETDSPFTYDLVFEESQEIGRDLSYDVEHRDLATVDARYPATAAGQAASLRREMTSPCVCTLTPPLQLLRLPLARTEYLSPDPIQWRDRLVGSSPFSPFLGWSLADVPRRYAERRTYRAEWASGPLVPGVATASQATRTGDRMSFSLPSATDSHPEHGGNFGTVTARLLRDGAVVRTFDFGVIGSADVPPEDAPYRLEVSARRVPNSAWATTLASDTAWTFHSARPSAGAAPLPLIDLDYRLGLDELNRARADRTHLISIGARILGAASPVRLRSLAVDVTYDDGETWRAARVLTRRRRGLGDRAPSPPRADERLRRPARARRGPRRQRDRADDAARVPAAMSAARALAAPTADHGR